MSRHQNAPAGLWGAAPGGMRRLDYDDLAGAPTPALVRLATWLGVAPRGAWRDEVEHRRQCITAVMAAEDRLAGMMPAMRCRLDATMMGLR